MRFNIVPGTGALPIRFGMKRTEVHALLGPPVDTTEPWGKSQPSDDYLDHYVNIGYTDDGLVNHVGFVPGDYELLFQGVSVWSPQNHPDPNPVLLQADPAPVSSVGFLVFDRIAVTTGGYHNDHEYDRALTVYPPGTWNLSGATVPDLSRYGRS